MLALTTNRPRGRWLLLPLILVWSGTAAAATNDQLERRIQRLEQELHQQKQQQAQVKKEQQRGNSVLGNTTFNLGGYVKLDVIHSSYSQAGGGIPSDRGRAFYIPALVPVGPGEKTYDSATDFQARQTRVHVGSTTDFGANKVKSFIEIDFYGSAFDANPGNSERLVNRADLSLRHAFFQWDDANDNQWLFGQTWSNFMDLGAYPETLDFVGPAEGLIFIRQAQVRWTRGPVAISLENPATTITPIGGGRIANDNDLLPDAVGRFTLPLGNKAGHLGFGVLLRQLSSDGLATGDDKEFAYGVNFTGKLKLLERDDIRFQLNYGDGIGRYLGLNTANGAVLQNNNSLEAIQAWGGYVSLRHFWTQKWRSNLTYGYFGADNDTSLTGTAVTERAQSVHANLIYQVLDPLSFGVEYLFADRETENGNDGQLHRVQFSAKYDFDFTSR